MYTNQAIEKQVKELISKYKTADPFELVKYLDIVIMEQELGNINGYYTFIDRNKCIVLNSSLNEYGKKISCCHELGHAILHPKLNKFYIERCTKFVKDRYETEADTFAAHLLLNYLKKYDCVGMTLAEIAATHEVNEKHVKLKFKTEFE
ncbi:ImmA/IrrE family metallo-endopeptidase [Clostridium grantii]|uniref:IrrE N-terminal-like domain-containing protein n=1 Tax=Clostridium grantii DSM 8605 TaxID=1121316 RepID=A0A1M5REI3_9CLOT|nr:ImmA/IrrE family metallo-endopeptidase [Clostridium grantii]SHH24684.1 protein of unknown function [Clostridium grantii DSM 8605]